MDFLKDMMGGYRREEYREFRNRYDRGALYDSISDEEVARRYNEVAR